MSAAIELLLFDLDGVLLDSKRNMEMAWGAVRSELATDIPFEAYFSQIGRPFEDIMQALGLADQSEQARTAYFQSSIENAGLIMWYPGVARILRKLAARKIKIGIVTSKDGQRTQRLLASLPVEFATVQTPIKGVRGKPAPDHLLLACAQTNTDPDNTLYIGDMIFDYQAAVRARLSYVHANWGYGELPSENCQALDSIDQLAQFLGLESKP